MTAGKSTVADLVPVLREITPELAAQIDDGLVLIWFLGDPGACPVGIERVNWHAVTTEAPTMLRHTIDAIRWREKHLRDVNVAEWVASRRAPRLLLWVTDEVAYDNVPDVMAIALTGRITGIDVVCTTELQRGRFHVHP